MELKLGQTLIDATTGFKGIAVNKTEFMNGNIQFSLQPPVTANNEYPDTISIDYHMLDVVDDGVSARVIPSTFESPVKLGNEVECIITGIKGIATLKTHCLNGCAAFLVTERTDAGKDKAVETWIDQHRLKVVGQGVAKEYVKPEAPNGKPTGGPVMRGIPRF